MITGLFIFLYAEVGFHLPSCCCAARYRFRTDFPLHRFFWLIGQKTCYKTAIVIEISMAIAVLSFLKEDKGWTKNVFRMHVND
jgi:hypothetical protein